MFAVPGWSLSPALLKTQVDTPQNINESNQTPKASKKRKRRNNENGSIQVTNTNVADLWKEHVEGIKPVRAKEEQKVISTKRIRTTKNGETESSASGTKQPQNDIQNSRQSNGLKKEKKSVEDSLRQTQVEQERVAPFKTLAVVQNDNKPETKLTPLQAAMKQKLISARFRHLNQTLYTAPSSETMTLFETNPTFFEEYHSGFRQQVSAWPDNPVDGYVEELKKRGKVRDQKGRRKSGPSQMPNDETSAVKQVLPLPTTEGTCTVADLGCGDAKLANQVKMVAKKLNIHLLSYDLQSTNSMVTKADIANLPLANGKVNVAIFCLALMGTNWVDFIDEAWRILHWKGELWVAEIKSRFGRPTARQRVDHSVGKKRKPNADAQKKQKNKGSVDAGDEGEEGTASREERLMVEVDGAEPSKNQTDVSAFVAVLRKHGFELTGDGAVDLSNKMFVKMRFMKALTPIKGKNVQEGLSTAAAPGLRKQQKAMFLDGEQEDEADEAAVLKPCLYKIR